MDFHPRKLASDCLFASVDTILHRSVAGGLGSAVTFFHYALQW